MKRKKLADQRAINDPSLRAGDIVSTRKGFLVFQGLEDGEHQWRNFRSATEFGDRRFASVDAKTLVRPTRPAKSRAFLACNPERSGSSSLPAQV